MLRGTRGTRLTQVGKLIASASRPVVDAARELARTIDGLPRVETTPLRIAASLTIAEQLVPLWLADRRISNLVEPGQAVLSVGNSDEVMEWVTDESADIGFVEGNRIRSGLAHQPIGRDELVVVVGPSHRWYKRPSPILPTDLVRGGLVLRERGSGTLEVIEDALAREHLTLPRNLPSFGSTSAILTAVRHGGAAAVVSRLTVENDVAEGKLAAIEVAGLNLTRTLSAVWVDNRSQRTDAAAMISNVAKIWGGSEPAEGVGGSDQATAADPAG